MKRILLTKLLYLFLMTGVVVSCSKNSFDSRLNNFYSGKSAPQPGSGVLNLTYSGHDYYGREAYFEMQTSATANIKLFKVFPKEDETLIKDVILTPAAGGGYSFTGTSISDKGTTFSYSGSVAAGSLSLALTDVKIPGYSFANGGVFETRNYSVVSFMGATGFDITITSPLKLDWKSAANNGEDVIRTFTAMEKLFQEGGLDVYADFGAILGKLIYLVLPQLTFHEDGNITVQYSGLKEGLDIMSLIAMPVTAADRKEVITLPRNILFYFIDGNTVSVQLNLEGIKNYIAANGTDYSGGFLADMFDFIAESCPTLIDRVQNGINFNFKVNDPGTQQDMIEVSNVPCNFFFTGDYQLYADKEELADIVRILPELFMFLGEKGVIPAEMTIAGQPIDLIEALIQWATYTTDFNLGLYLSY